MNNHRLLAGLLCATLLSAGVRAYGDEGALSADPAGGTVVTLEEIFEAAETNSAMLRPSFSAEEEARREVSVAKSARLPEINASLSVSYIGDGFTTERDFSDYQKAPIPHFGNGLGLTVEQPLYTGGAISNAIGLAELKSEAARYSTELNRADIRFRLAGFYFDIFKYTNLRSVVEQNIELARKVLAEMRARHEQGVALRNDITRYELLVSNLELRLVKINNTLEILNHSLVVTAGLPEGTVVSPDPSILDRSLSAAGEGWWRQMAGERSPSLKLARQSVEISRKAESLARSERLPKIGLKASWSIDGPILVEVPPINRNLSYWYVGLGVSYNISSLFKANKTIAKSRAATVTALDRLKAADESLTLGVRADYIRYLEAYQELDTQRKSVELAERNYRTTSTRYSADMALITDMLDAANAKLEAEQLLVNARINIIYSYYKLLFTTGQI